MYFIYNVFYFNSMYLFLYFNSNVSVFVFNFQCFCISFTMYVFAFELINLHLYFNSIVFVFVFHFQCICVSFPMYLHFISDVFVARSLYLGLLNSVTERGCYIYKWCDFHIQSICVASLFGIFSLSQCVLLLPTNLCL